MKKQTMKTITEDYFKCSMQETKNYYGKKVLFCEGKEGETNQVILNKNGTVNIVFREKEISESLKSLFNNLRRKNKLFSEVWKNATNKLP